MMDVYRCVEQFLKDLDEHNYRLHGLSVIQQGEVLYESTAAPYLPDTPHRLFSTAKSLYVLDVLYAIQEGFLRPEDRIAPLFPEFQVSDPGLLQMTLDDLLTMRTGQEGDPFPALFENPDADLVRMFFETPVTDEKPGLKFRYNNTVPSVILAVVEKATGEPIASWQDRHLTKTLNAPLFAPFNGIGQYNPVITCASLRTLTEYARFFVNEGRIGDRQLIQPDLFRRAVADHLLPDRLENGDGYGWQIWHNPYGGYRMDGGWGQMVFVVPETRSAVSVLSDMTDYSAVVEAYRKHFLPFLQEGSLTAGEDAPPLRSLAPQGDASPDPGLNHSAWKMEDGTEIHFSFDDSHVAWVVNRQGRQIVRQAGLHGAFESSSGYQPRPFSIDYTVIANDPATVLMSAAWIKPDTLRVVGKCMAEMGEHFCEFEFGRTQCRMRQTVLCVHGIAERQPDQWQEVMMCRIPNDC